MSVTTADQKRRVVLPEATPGDVFDVQQSENGRYILVKLVRPPSTGRRTAAEVITALDKAPLQSRLRWDAIRRMTRES